MSETIEEAAARWSEPPYVNLAIHGCSEAPPMMWNFEYDDMGLTVYVPGTRRKKWYQEDRKWSTMTQPV